MKYIVCFVLVIYHVVFIGGCTTESETTDTISTTTIAGLPGNDSGPSEIPISVAGDNPTPSETQIPTVPPSPTLSPGSIALFATISGDSQNEFLRVEGGNVSWDTTHYKFLRYIPEDEILDEFGWTSSKSYSSDRDICGCYLQGDYHELSFRNPTRRWLHNNLITW